jgi:outer membrane lipoprotein carrier protein
MMRWEYRSPEEKLFVSDGRTVYLYVPEERQVTRESVDDSFDDRIPLMFLLGRSDLENEFERIERLASEPQVAGTEVLRMYPRRENDIEEVLLEVDPASFDIRRLRLAYRDGSVSEFIFNGIRTNTGVDPSRFEFEPPPGVDVVEGIGN